MKKRILSLLLAFSMAATLAPATALVGSSTSQAAAATAALASSATVVAKYYSPAGQTVQNGGEVIAYPGDELTVVLTDTNNGGNTDAYYSLSVTESDAGLNISGTDILAPKGYTGGTDADALVIGTNHTTGDNGDVKFAPGGKIEVASDAANKAGRTTSDVTITYRTFDRTGGGTDVNPYGTNNVTSATFKFKVKVLPIINSSLKVKLGTRELQADTANFVDNATKVVDVVRGNTINLDLVDDAAINSTTEAVDVSTVAVSGTNVEVAGTDNNKIKVDKSTLSLSPSTYANTLAITVPSGYTGDLEVPVTLKTQYNKGKTGIAGTEKTQYVLVRVVEKNSQIVPVDADSILPKDSLVDKGNNTFELTLPRGGKTQVSLYDKLHATKHAGPIKLNRVTDTFTKIGVDGSALTSFTNNTNSGTLVFSAEKDTEIKSYELVFQAFNATDDVTTATPLDIDGDGDSDNSDVIVIKVKVTASLASWGADNATYGAGTTLDGARISLAKGTTETLSFARLLTPDYATNPDANKYGQSASNALVAADDIVTVIETSTPMPTSIKASDYNKVLGAFFNSGTATSKVTVPAGATRNRTLNVAAGTATGVYSFTATTYVNGVAGDVAYFQVQVGKTTTWTFDANGGSIEHPAYTKGDDGKYTVENPRNVAINVSTFPTPIRDGYVFRYWEYNGNQATGTYQTDVERTFKAVWTKSLGDVSIILDSNGVTPNTGAATYSTDYDIDSTIDKSFVSTGRTQIGWSTMPNATVKMYDVKAKVTTEMVNALVSANNGMTLYAVWSTKSYTIKYEANVPVGQSLSSSSVAVKEQTKTFGTDIRLRANTFHVPGYRFDGWYYSVGSSNNSTWNYAGMGGDLVDDSDVGNNGELTVVTLHAIWVQGHSYVLHTNETGSSPWRVASGDLPNATNRVGWFVEEWKGSDEYTYEVGETVNASIDLNPVYRELPISYNVQYLAVGGDIANAYQASKHFSTFDVASATQTLPTRTAPNATFIGWEAYIADTNVPFNNLGNLPAGALKLDDIYKNSFKTLDMATALEAEFGRSKNYYATNASDLTVYFVPVWKITVNGAAVQNPAITVPYGTPIDVVERLVRPYVNYKGSNNVVTPYMNRVSDITFTNASSYNATKAGKYVLTASVKPVGSTDSKFSTYTVYPVEVTVSPKADTRTYVTKIAKIDDINLPIDVKVADVFAAVSDVNTLKVTDENGREYKLTLAGISGGTDQWTLNANNMDVIVEKTSPYNNAWLRSNASNLDAVIDVPMSFIFRMDLNSLNSDLAYVNTAAVGTALDIATSNYQYAYVKVNVGTASSGSIVDPEADEIPAGTVATTEAQVRELLNNNYTLRFFNKVTGEHLYTTDWSEYAALITNKNWVHETYVDGTNVFKASATWTEVYNTPVYRLFSAANREHLYTKDLNEVAVLTASKRWTLDDKSIIYVSMDKGGTPYYRQSRVSKLDGKNVLQHHYAPKAEFDANNASGKGWRADFDGEPIWYSPAN